MALTEWKDITVFISSTFNDMHAERDYLVKFVFPELREWCARRKLRLNDIDLRWGITSSDSQTKRTIGICLRDIDKSRPYFIGFLGQRRGWQPSASDIDEETGREYPELQERLSSVSVTELEIEHALLAPLIRMAGEEKVRPEMARHAFVFLRDDTFSQLLTPAQKRIYTNWAEAAEGENPNTSPLVQKADEDLAEFRARLEERIPKTRHYRAAFDTAVYSPELGQRDCEESRGRLVRFETEGKPLKDVLLESMEEAILEDYPERRGEILETTDQDIRDSYIQRMAAGYIERRADLDAVQAYLQSGTGRGVMVLHGPSGAGKTTLMAEIFLRCRQDPDMRVLIRCCGVGNDTTTVYGVFRGMFEEMGIPCPLDMGDLKENILSLLARAGSVKTVLLIDALDQIPQGTEVLSWLPGTLPDNIKLVASIRTDFLQGGQAADVLAGRGAVLYGIQPFTGDEDKKLLVDAYLKSHLKSLDREQMKILFRKKGSSNPLYLLAVLSELRLVGKFQMIDSRLESFGELPEDIFDAMMQRMEEDYLAEGLSSEKIVSLLCSLLGVSRYGLLKEELDGIFAAAFPEEDREELAGRIQVYIRQMRDFLLQFGSFTDFRYFAIRRAANGRYRDMAERSHARIADYFLEKMGQDFEKADERALKESVYHLFRCRPDSAWKLITDIRFLERKLEVCGVSPLIEDFEYAAGCTSLSQDLGQQAAEIATALKKSSYILSNDPSELPGQLALRLGRVGDVRHMDFLDSMAKQIDHAWIRTKALNEGNSDYILFREGQDQIIALFVCGEGILTLEKDGAVKILSEEDGSVIRHIRGGGIRAVCGCLAGDRLYILDEGGWAYSYGILSGMLIGSAKVTDRRPWAIAGSKEGIVVTDREDGACSIDPETLQVRARINFQGGAECAAIWEDRVVFGCRYGKILECRLNTLEVMKEYDPDFGLITAIYVDRYYIYAGGDLGVLVCFNRGDGTFTGTVQGYGYDHICTIFKAWDMIFTLNGFQAWKYSSGMTLPSRPEGIFQTVRLAAIKDDRIFFLTSDYRLGCIRAEGLQEFSRLQSTFPAAGLCLSPDRVLLWNRAKGFQFFDRESGKEREGSVDSIIKYKDEKIESAAAIEDGFLIGTSSGKLRRISKKGEPKVLLHNRPAMDILDPFYVSVKYLACRGSRALYVGFHDLYLADLETNEVKKLFTTSGCIWLSMEDDRFYYAAGSEIRTCTLPEGTEIRKFEIRPDPQKILLEGGILYAGYPDGILAYEMESGRKIREIYQGSFRDFGVMGSLLAVALADRTLRIYRDGSFLCLLTLDDIPCALTCGDDDGQLYVGTYRGSFLKLAIENARGRAAGEEKAREKAFRIESPGEAGDEAGDQNAGNTKKSRRKKKAGRKEEMDEATFRVVYDQDPFVTGGRLPRKYKPPVIGNYKGVTRIFAACAVMILLLSGLGACVFFRTSTAAYPELLSVQFQELGIIQRLWALLFGICITVPAMLAFFWLNHVREERSFYSDKRPAECFLPPLVFWAAAGVLYFLAILSVPADGFRRAMAVQVLWLLPWVLQLHMKRRMDRKPIIYYGPRCTFTAERDREFGFALLGALLMILMLVFIWITRFISWLL